MLAEILGINLAIWSQKNQKIPYIANADASEEKYTLVIDNFNNVHWGARIQGSPVPTVGDGNCGYNALALCLRAGLNPVQNPIKKDENALESKKSHAPSKHRYFKANSKEAATIKQLIQKENQALKQSIKESRLAQKAHYAALKKLKSTDPDQYLAVKKQINDDYLLALALYLADLPDHQGKMKNPTKDNSLLMGSFKTPYLKKIKAQLHEEIQENLQLRAR